MTLPNKTAFVLACVTVIFATVAYGGVHQPIIALIYLLTSLMMLLWAIDGFASGRTALSRSPLLLPLAALAGYGFLQIIPFGTTSDAAGLTDIPRTISLAPFDTL